jgi:hypothetical protein
MKRVTQFVFVMFIVFSLADTGLSQDQDNLFDGYWRTERGTLIRIEGDQAVMVRTPVESWKEFVGTVVARNIRQEGGKWIADEFLLPHGEGIWKEIEWDPQGDIIVRRLYFEGTPVVSYYTRTTASYKGTGAPAVASQTRPSPRMERKNKSYVAVKGGFYGPTGDLDDIGYDDGFTGEVAIGRFVNPNLAIEAGVGYVSTEASMLVYLSDPSIGYGSVSENNEITAIPITITIKGVVPGDIFELHLGGGVGYYIGTFEGNLSGSGVVTGIPVQGTATFEDDENVFGLHVVGDLIVNITDAFFIGVEGKHIWTEEAKVEGTVDVVVNDMSFGVPIRLEGNVNGYMVTGVIGFRF